MVRVVIVIFACVTLTPQVCGAEEAEPDEFELLHELRSEFQSGNYENVFSLGEQILGTEPSSAVRAETYQYLGAAAALLGRADDADEYFEELLTLQPNFRLEEAFPTEVLTLYETVRLRMEDRLRQIEEARRRAQEAERLERERRLAEEQARLQRLTRPRYVRQQIRQRHLAIAFVPFGAGQFQNEQPAKGFAFMGAQAGLTAASMVLWLFWARLPEPATAADIDRGRTLSTRYQIASYAVVGTLATAIVWGIIDALVNFRRRTVSWTELEEEDVPEPFRLPPPSLARL